MVICCGDFQAVRNEGKDPFHWFWRKFMTSTGTNLWNHFPNIIWSIWHGPYGSSPKKIGLSGSDMWSYVYFFPNPLVVDLQLDLNLTRLVCTWFQLDCTQFTVYLYTTCSNPLEHKGVQPILLAITHNFKVKFSFCKILF